jgi:hypothetical protein
MKRLRARRPLVRAAADKAEALYVSGAKAAFREARRIVLDAVTGLEKAAGEELLGHESLTLRAVRNALEQGLTKSAQDAAGVMVKGENDWFAGTGAVAFPDFEPLDGGALFDRYEASLSGVGGFKGMGDTASANVMDSVRRWYQDENADINDLKDAIGSDLADWKATQIAITESTRMGAAEGQMVADQVDATQAEVDSLNDAVVCSECDALNGTVIDVTDLVTTLPVHPGCRCGYTLLIPETDEERAVVTAMSAGDDDG